MADDGVHLTSDSYETLRTAIISHMNTQHHYMHQQGVSQLRSNTPLLRTPNMTPSEIIYLPTLPTYVNHRTTASTTTIPTATPASKLATRALPPH